MRIFSVQGANIVVGGKRIIFAPFTPVELPQETADYLLSTGRLYKEGETPKELAADLIVRPIKIGVHRIGGFGDALLGSCVITALARKFPSCQITAHTHSTIQKLWLGHPKIHHQDSGYHPRLNNSPYSVQGYDAFFNLMPDCYVEYNKRTMPAELVAMAQHARAEIDRYKKMPGVLNHLKPFCRDRNFEALDVFNFCFGTDAKVTDMYFNQTEKDKTCYDRFVKDKIIPEKYITIHDS